MGASDETEGGGMNDPVRIFGGQEPAPVEPLLTFEEIQALDKARFQRRTQGGFLIFLGVLVLALVSPLVIWLARIAGGW